MQEIVIETKTLPDPLPGFFNTTTVTILPLGDEIRIIPTDREPKQFHSPLIGLLKGTALSIDHFLIEKQKEKERE
jgi:hypothetical protein